MVVKWLHQAGKARRDEAQARVALLDHREALKAEADQEQARNASLVRQGALARPDQEHRAGADAVCAVEPVAEAKAVDV